MVNPLPNQLLNFNPQSHYLFSAVSFLPGWSVLWLLFRLEGNTGAACNFIKKETLAQVFSCEFCEISKNTFFYRTPLVVASVLNLWNCDFLRPFTSEYWHQSLFTSNLRYKSTKCIYNSTQKWSPFVNFGRTSKNISLNIYQNM